MCEIQDYLKSMNPYNDGSLIYGKEYRLYRNGNYIGNAIWTEDENVGDSFQRTAINQQGEVVEICHKFRQM